MDRLTEWHDGHGDLIRGDGYTKLARYEDTGLEPEEIKEQLHESTGPLHKRLGEWIDADRKGRLPILPCAIGDAVWGIRNHKGHVCAHHGFVSEMYYSKDMKLIIVIKNICRGEFGKSVFHTREQAEKALAERKEIKV